MQKVGVKRADGYLYFIDKGGDVSRVKMARGGKKGGKAEKVAKVGVKKARWLSFTSSTKPAMSRERRWFAAEKAKKKK